MPMVCTLQDESFSLVNSIFIQAYIHTCAVKAQGTYMHGTTQITLHTGRRRITSTMRGCSRTVKANGLFPCP
jgi:hypothetical protein